MENKETNISIGDFKTKSTSMKIKDFFKQKFAYIILTIGCLFFAFKDVINWEKTEESWIVIGLDFLITYIFTLYVTIIMGRMGMKSGKNSEQFKATLDYYSRAKTETENIRGFLPQYCAYKTEEEKKAIQREILYQENLFLDKLNEYQEKDLDKKQWKAVLKARQVEVYRLVDRELVSERGKSYYNKYGTYLGKKESQYETENTAVNAFTKLFIPLVFCFIGVESLVWSNLLMGLLKSLIIVLGGTINYFNNEDFAVNELRNRFINKADCLFDFKNLLEKHPELFEENKN